MVLLVTGVALAQSPWGYESGPGSCMSEKAHEIIGLPPVDTHPVPPSTHIRPLSPEQVDPHYQWTPFTPQLDLGGSMDAPPLEQSFQGITDTGWFPPDPIIAAGPSYLVACTNSHIAYFTRTGSRLLQTSASTFFSSVGTSGMKIFDPWVIYDETSSRFMILFAGKNTSGSNRNYNYLAISKTSSPLNGWWLYRNDMMVNGSTPSSNWGDYPKLAADRNAIYITANMFQFGGSMQYSKIRIMQNKSQLLSGTTSQLWWDFWNITVSGSTTKAHTIQPALDADSKTSTGAAYFCSCINGTGSNIYFYGITDVTNRTTGPTFHKTRVSVGSYANPGDFPQQGGSEKVENVAPRLMNAVKRNGSIWTAHSIKISSVSGCRWYEFKVGSWPTSGSVTRNQESTFWGGSSLWYSYPAVAVNRANHMAMVFCYSGTSQYVGTRYSGRLSTEALNTLQGSAWLKAGEAYYVRKSSGRNRWGDYYGCSAAPDGSIWFIGEYAVANNKWSTRIGQVFVPAAEKVDYWVSSFGGTQGNKLLGYDWGTLTTSVSLSSPVAPCSVCMGHYNYRALVFDTDKIYRYYLDDQSSNPGNVFSSTLPAAGNIQWGGVDEAGYIFYVDSTGRLYRGTGIYGSGVSTLRYSSGSSYNAVAWNGQTGQYVAVTYGSTSSTSRIHFISRNGVLVRNVAGPTYMSGIDFDPFSGYMYISRFGQTTGYGVARLTQSGTWSYLGPTGSALFDTANSIECQDQPSARMIGTEYGGAPQHIFRIYSTGTAYTTHASSGVFGPSDLAINRQRVLWTTTRMQVGATGSLSLNFGPQYAGDIFQVATALGYQPGFAVSGKWIHLAAGDFLITASILGYDGGSIWKNFTGFLDVNGRAVPTPTVTVPAIPSLKGMRFYFAAVAFNNVQGIKAASNLCGITIE